MPESDMNCILVALALAPQQPADPLNLPIGRPGGITVRKSAIANLETGRTTSLSGVLDHASRSRFVYIGESHTSPEHHQFQAAVIDGLTQRGYDVIVGLEMFTRPVQDALDPWTLGWWNEEEFIARSDWKKQWGFPFDLYKPIFDATKKHKLRMVALNVPRDWVRSVGRGGWSALSDEQKAQVPAWTDPHPKHRQVFDALIGGHPMSGDQAKNMYTAQCLWDIGMADSAVKYLKRAYNGPKTIFVIVAGSGHIMYDAGIPYRIAEYLGNPAKTTIVCVDAATQVKVSRGLGDFVYASEPTATQPQ